MAIQKTTNRKPTHSLYHVRGEGKNAFWTKLGAAWMHDDQGGLNLSVDYMPVVSEGRLVVRAVKADEPANEGAQS